VQPDKDSKFSISYLLFGAVVVQTIILFILLYVTFFTRPWNALALPTDLRPVTTRNTPQELPWLLIVSKYCTEEGCGSWGMKARWTKRYYFWCWFEIVWRSFESSRDGVVEWECHVYHVRFLTRDANCHVWPLLVMKIMVSILCPTNSLSVWYSTRHLNVAILSPSSHALDRFGPMTVLEVFGPVFTEMRFENPITTPTTWRRLNTRKAEVMEDEAISERGDEKVC